MSYVLQFATVTKLKTEQYIFSGQIQT